ncbi:MAG: hypothetical protein AAB502_02480, partial [Chloroflexota bacterium]
LRQNFYAKDVGRFKAQALAERLCPQFQRPVGYSCSAVKMDQALPLDPQGTVVVGCVDNAEARKALAADFQGRAMPYGSVSKYWWVDSGNGDTFGQVLIGNVTQKLLKLSFMEKDGLCCFLPLPTLQMPSILIPAPEPAPAPDCAQAVLEGDQDPVINQMMAAAVLTVLERLLTGSCTWMRLSVDMRRGYIQPQEATPENVARLMGVSIKYLTGVSKSQKKGGDTHGRNKPRGGRSRRRPPRNPASGQQPANTAAANPGPLSA